MKDLQEIQGMPKINPDAPQFNHGLKLHHKWF